MRRMGSLWFSVSQNCHERPICLDKTHLGAVLGTGRIVCLWVRCRRCIVWRTPLAPRRMRLRLAAGSRCMTKPGAALVGVSMVHLGVHLNSTPGMHCGGVFACGHSLKHGGKQSGLVDELSKQVSKKHFRFGRRLHGSQMCVDGSSPG